MSNRSVDDAKSEANLLMRSGHLRVESREGVLFYALPETPRGGPPKR